MNIPVVTVHSYNAKSQKTDYTAEVIAQCLHTGNIVYSLTDYKPHVVNNSSQHINISIKELHTNDLDTFNQNYVHLSTNPINFERAAISKFFLIREFMYKYNYKRIFHIDSDVLLYKPVQSFAEYYEQYEFTLTHNHQCGNSFFDISVIEDLCDKILKIYTLKEKYFWFNDLKLIFETMTQTKQYGGICDMTILSHYKQRRECNSLYMCGEMTDIIDNFRFDHHIRHVDPDYEMQGERRKITFINNCPYSFNNKLNKNIEFASLHFGGKAKEYLHEYTTYNL